jgi:hypothetical protein
MPGHKTLIYVTAELYTNHTNGYARLVFKDKKVRTKFLRDLREGRRMKAFIRDLDSLGIRLGLIDLKSDHQTSYCLWLQLATPSGAKINFYTI